MASDDEIREVFDFWVQVCAKIPARTHYSDQRRELLRRALARYPALVVRMAVAAGAVNPYHWDHGHTKIETLLDPFERVLKNADRVTPKTVQAAIDRHAAEWSALRQDLDAYRITQGNGIDVAQRAKIARLRGKIERADVQLEALHDLLRDLANHPACAI
jgi:hypothetical protein